MIIIVCETLMLNIAYKNLFNSSFNILKVFYLPVESSNEVGFYAVNKYLS